MPVTEDLVEMHLCSLEELYRILVLWASGSIDNTYRDSIRLVAEGDRSLHTSLVEDMT
jgi:hypothetical protein